MRRTRANFSIASLLLIVLLVALFVAAKRRAELRLAAQHARLEDAYRSLSRNALNAADIQSGKTVARESRNQSPIFWAFQGHSPTEIPCKGGEAQGQGNDLYAESRGSCSTEATLCEQMVITFTECSIMKPIKMMVLPPDPRGPAWTTPIAGSLGPQRGPSPGTGTRINTRNRLSREPGPSAVPARRAKRLRNRYFAMRPTYTPSPPGARARFTFEPLTQYYSPNEDTYYPIPASPR